jgi:hypothetical protein
LADDRRCCRCGYNLRGLAPAEHCPECALLVRDSLVGGNLRYADWRWLGKVRLGLLLLLIAVGGVCASVLLFAAAIVIGGFTGLDSGSASEAIAISALVVVTASIVPGFFGILLLTWREPAERPGWPARARRWARGLMWTLMVLGGTTALFSGPSFVPAFLRYGASPWLIIADIVVALPLAVAASLYMGHLVGRAGAADADLALWTAAGVVVTAVSFVCWYIAFFAPPVPEPLQDLFRMGAVLLLGIGPTTLVLLFMLVRRTHRAVNRARREDPDRYGRMLRSW